ncbi:hypothetical protein NL676_027945 [Syzygium grande]|nr:hypothetical protein NL676_027945 [Syzygium grande]
MKGATGTAQRFVSFYIIGAFSSLESRPKKTGKDTRTQGRGRLKSTIDENHLIGFGSRRAACGKEDGERRSEKGLGFYVAQIRAPQISIGLQVKQIYGMVSLSGGVVTRDFYTQPNVRFVPGLPPRLQRYRE